jgi:hypothetical protein
MLKSAFAGGMVVWGGGGVECVVGPMGDRDLESRVSGIGADGFFSCPPAGGLA